MELRAIKTFYDSRMGLVTLEDDVLSIVSQVRQLYADRIIVLFEPTNGWYHLVENCSDGEQRLIFTTEDLDGRVLDRLLAADSQSRGHGDPYDFAEREQDRLLAEGEARSREAIAEQGERLVHALKHDGLQPHLPLQVAVPRGIEP